MARLPWLTSVRYSYMGVYTDVMLADLAPFPWSLKLGGSQVTFLHYCTCGLAPEIK